MLFIYICAKLKVCASKAPPSPSRKTLGVSLKKRNMITLVKKYSILLIASNVISLLLATLILYLSPNLLTTQTPDGATQTYGITQLKVGIDFLINIIFIFLLYREMKTLKVMSTPILILTFFSSLIGVIFLFIISAYENLTTKQFIR